MFRALLNVALILVAWDCLSLVAVGQAQEWGDIEGRVVLKGPIHPRRAIVFTGHPDAKYCEQDNDAFEEDWVVNKENRGLKNVMVWIRPAGMAKDQAFPTKLIHPKFIIPKLDMVEVDIPVCRFTPHVLGAREGQKFVIKNSSELAPDVKLETDKNGLHHGQISAGTFFALPKPLVAETSAILLESPTHPWMRAYMRIFDHPYFAVTDENGKFTIKNAPAGKFNIWYWHPEEGWLGGRKGRNGYPIEIKPGKNKLSEIQFVGPEKPLPARTFESQTIPKGNPNRLGFKAIQVSDPNLPRGNLRGRVVWKGEIPQRKPIDLRNQPDKEALAREKLFEDDLIINAENKGVKDVVVWISDRGPYDEFPPNLINPKLEKPENNAVVLNISSGRFEPHVVVARKGQDLVVQDKSNLTHRIDWYSLRNSSAEAIHDGKKLTLHGLKLDPWPTVIKCGLHPWMKAHLRVFDHPYFAVTDSNGTFTIADAPTGVFRLYCWHPEKGMLNGKMGQMMTIKKGDNDLGVTEISK